MNKRKILFKEYSGCVSITRKDIHKALKNKKFSDYIRKVLYKYTRCVYVNR